MALMNESELGREFGGIKVKDVYVRIFNLSIPVIEHEYVDISVAYYGILEQRQKNVYYRLRQDFDIPKAWFADTVCGKNALITKAYEFLKKLPEFAEAVDV